MSQSPGPTCWKVFGLTSRSLRLQQTHPNPGQTRETEAQSWFSTRSFMDLPAAYVVNSPPRFRRSLRITTLGLPRARKNRALLDFALG